MVLKKRKREEQKELKEKERLSAPPQKRAAPEEKKIANSSNAAAANLVLEDVEKISYANKEHLVYEFSVRWWYALPEPWPPVNFDYSQKLREQKLRKLEAGQRFKAEPEIDGSGFKKVYEVENFSGIFKDSKGATFDLRPQESCPSLNNFAKKERAELQTLLMTAYESQL